MRILVMILVLLVLTQSAPSSAPVQNTSHRASLPITNPPGTLGYYAAQKGLYFGSEITFCCNGGIGSIGDAAYVELWKRQFNLTEAGVEMKFGATEPRRNRFDFTAGDKIVQLAQDNGMKVRGHNFAWDLFNPDWLEQYRGNGPELQTILVNHIQQVMGHFRDKFPGTVIAWDVVNEELENRSLKVEARNSIWSSIGSSPDDYMMLAFRTASVVDPNAALCLNDYADGFPARWDANIMLIAKMQAAGVPIQCFGAQMHMGKWAWGNNVPGYDWLMQKMAKLAAMGIQVHMTEVDFEFAPGIAGDTMTASGYWVQALQACVDSPNCTMFNMWDATNKHSGIPRLDGGTPFNPFGWNLETTPIYDAMLKVLAAPR